MKNMELWRLKMAKTKGRPQSYDSYVKEYNKIKESMNKQGFQMKSKLLTQKQWEVAHAALKADREDEIKNGQRKQVGNINRDIAKEQQWKFSSAQAHKMKDVIKKQSNTKASIKAIRSGKVEVDWVAIDEYRQNLIDSGMSKKDAQDIVQNEIWGSE